MWFLFYKFDATNTLAGIRRMADLNKRKRLIFQINLPDCIGLGHRWLRPGDSPLDRFSNLRGGALHPEFLEDINDVGVGGTLFDVEVLTDLF